jgi:hypothetical protein
MIMENITNYWVIIWGSDNFVKLDLPFYKNDGDGNQCLQVTLKTAIKHFLNIDFSLEEMDELTGRKPGFWSFPSQGVMVLHRLGLDVDYYSREPLEPYLEGESHFRKLYGKDADKILKFTDMPVVLNSFREVLDKDMFQVKILLFEKIEEFIRQGYLVIMNIDWNIIEGIVDDIEGHSVILTGYDLENVYYHDSGPSTAEANRKVNKEIFIKAWNAADNDVIVVKGLRKE